MNSDLGEKIVFEKSVVCTGGVEIWLNTLLSMVRDTVRNVIALQCQALVDPEYDFIIGFVQSCGQVRFFVPILLSNDFVLFFYWVFRLGWWVFKCYGPRKLRSR